MNLAGLGTLGIHLPDEAKRLMDAAADLLEGKTYIRVMSPTPGGRTISVQRTRGSATDGES